MGRLIADGLRLDLLSLEALVAAEYLGRSCLAASDHTPRSVRLQPGVAVRMVAL